MNLDKPLRFQGSNALRFRLALSCISGRPIIIEDIHASSDEENPGLAEYEFNLLKLLDAICDGITLTVSKTHTTLTFYPGLLVGKDYPFVHKCSLQRGIPYYLEFLMLLAPLMKHPLDLKLEGITDHPEDISIDAFKVTAKNLGGKIGLPPININVERRGVLPNGGGRVHFTCETMKHIKPFQLLYPGRITRVRGSVWTCHMSSPFATRSYDSARRVLNELLSDVWVYTDPAKGPKGGASPGFGLSLVAESMKGCNYSACAMFDKSSHSCHDRFKTISNQEGAGAGDIPAILGEEVACKLLAEIVEGGTVDSHFQWLVLWYMALADNYGPSRVLIGRLSLSSVILLRHLEQFLAIKFSLQTYEEAWNFAKVNKLADGIGDDEDNPELTASSLLKPSAEHDVDVESDVDDRNDCCDEEKGKVEFKEERQQIEKLRMHTRVVATCVGGGVPNMARQTF